MVKSKIILRPTSILTKQIGQLTKLFGLKGNGNNKFPKIDEPYRKEGIPNFLAQRKGLNTKFITRRQIVMNRHFTEIISDVMLNSISKDLAGLGVTITSIETKAWNKGVDVFYYTESGFDSEKQNQLQNIIKDLRRSITERRLIGRTPVVNFVLDKSIILDRRLETALGCVKNVTKEIESTQLVNPVTNVLQTTKQDSETVSGLTPHSFSAPDDMTNSIFGLDYPSLYNCVTAKMERGRALSSRMRPSDNIVLSTPPLIKGPRIDVEEEDPVKRIVNMQKFLINQKKKSQRLGKERRLEEILARNANRWEYPPDDNNRLDDELNL